MLDFKRDLLKTRVGSLIPLSHIMPHIWIDDNFLSILHVKLMGAKVAIEIKK